MGRSGLSRGASQRRRSLSAACLLIVAIAPAGCSVRRFAVDRVAGMLASPGTVWSGDDDPDLVGDALPFALKTYESLLAETPDNPRLLLATCRGFASYSAGWVEAEAERVESADFEAARAERERALGLHLRARGYCLRELERRLPGVAGALAATPETALARAGASDVELLYWSGVAWGSAVALGLDRPELVADLPAVRALFARALELDPAFDRGAVHEAMISIESVSELLGGSAERARAHYARAIELCRGERASPHVTFARSVLVGAQDRRGFQDALERALAVNLEAAPADRLSNRLAQRRARLLLARVDELFFAEEE